MVQGTLGHNKLFSKAFSDKQTGSKAQFSFWNLLFRCWASKINKQQVFPMKIKDCTSSQSYDQILSTNTFFTFWVKQKFDFIEFRLY